MYDEVKGFGCVGNDEEVERGVEIEEMFGKVLVFGLLERVRRIEEEVDAVCV